MWKTFHKYCDEFLPMSRYLPLAKSGFRPLNYAFIITPNKVKIKPFVLTYNEFIMRFIIRFTITHFNFPAK